MKASYTKGPQRLQMCLPEVYWHIFFHVLFRSVAGLPLLEGRHILKLYWDGLGIPENWVATPILVLHGLHGICRGAGGQFFQLVPCAVWGTFPKSDYFSVAVTVPTVFVYCCWKSMAQGCFPGGTFWLSD